MPRLLALTLTLAFVATASAQNNTPPAGYTALFNGKDLTNWRGIPVKANTNAKTKANRPYVAMTMPERLKATSAEMAEAQQHGDQLMRDHWKVESGVLEFDGKGQSLVTAKDYGDCELYCDWKIKERGDSGIYVRGTPQIQIWDPFNMPVAKNGEDKGSGGLFNNQKNPKDPSVMADKPIGEWNTFWVKIVGDKVTVKLNDKTVVDNVTMENYWERDKPLYPKGTIELQNHGNTLYFRNIYVKEL